jgi:hypothetical protein
MDLSYNVIQGFFEVASTKLGPVMPAPLAGQALNMEVTKADNRTEHIYMSATGSYYEEQRGNGEEHGSKPSDSQKGGGIHGLYVIGTFLACGFLITFGWGGISASLVSGCFNKHE